MIMKSLNNINLFVFNLTVLTIPDKAYVMSVQINFRVAFLRAFGVAFGIVLQNRFRGNFPNTLSGRTGSALAWRSEGRTLASQSVQ